MLEVKNFVNIGAGRKSNYEFAKDVLLKKYINEETVEINNLAKILRVTYTTARNYLFRFLSEELGKKDLPNFYKYKR